MNQESRIMNIKTKLKNIIHDSLFMIRKSRGFTLIELLIAISIIGILSSFLLANFVGVRQRARDGVRKSDLRQIQSALEFYRSDQGSYAPNARLDTCGVAFTSSNSAPIPNVTYMQKIPCDPSTGARYYYNDAALGTRYCVRACLENVNDANKDVPNNPSMPGCTSAASACAAGTNSYSLQNP